MKVYPPGSEPYVTLKRLDGFIGENMLHSVAQTICGWWPAPGSPRSEIDRIRARMMARQLEYERKKRITLRVRSGLDFGRDNKMTIAATY